MIPVQELAPGGTLRAAINLGNPVLARRKDDGSLGGVTVALAQEVARRAGLPLDLVPYDTAAKVVTGRREDGWDLAFLAVDPLRAAEIAFTAPYHIIEGVFIVRQDAPWTEPEQLDQPGVTIIVGRGAAYDLHLTRNFQHATLERVDSTHHVLPHLIASGLPAGAGIRQPAAAFAAANPDFRVIAKPFMEIRQALAIAPGRPAALAYLNDLLAELTGNGFLANVFAAENA